MASAYLSKSQGAGNKEKFTYSVWVKKHSGTAECVLLNAYSSSTYYSKIQVDSDGRFHYDDYKNSQVGRRSSTAKLRDVNGWYHLVAVWDTNNSTADDRMIIYVNGERISAFDHDSDPSSGADSYINDSSKTLYIGRKETNSVSADMTLTHAHFCDGYVYAPSDFGETDTTTGIWKPKVSPSVSYGTNGFFLKFDNSANMGLDSSGQSNNFTTTGTIIQNKDTPSNLFAVLNEVKKGKDQTLTNCNTTMASGTSSTRTPSQTTLGMSSGKYYAEFKILTSNNTVAGVASTQDNSSVSSGVGYYPGYTSSAWGYNGSSGIIVNSGSSVGGTYATFTTGDIIGIALDLDNNKLYFHKNGTYQNSGVPTSGSTGTGAVSITAPSSTQDGYYYFSVGDGSGGTASGADCNFGNGFFGTTAVSSAQNPDDGIGIFEYDVPAGYRALCTKSINAEEYS
jgi:hypothetical protein